MRAIQCWPVAIAAVLPHSILQRSPYAASLFQFGLSLFLALLLWDTKMASVMISDLREGVPGKIWKRKSRNSSFVMIKLLSLWGSYRSLIIILFISKFEELTHMFLNERTYSTLDSCCNPWPTFIRDWVLTLTDCVTTWGESVDIFNVLDAIKHPCIMMGCFALKWMGCGVFAEEVTVSFTNYIDFTTLICSL